MTARPKWPLWSSSAAFMLRWSLVLLVLDQATKLWILYGLQLQESDQIAVTPFFDLVLVWNRGISYGLLQQQSDIGRWLLAGVGIAACIVLWIWANRVETRSFVLGATLVIGGGIGNTIDRVIYGAVADFVSLHAFDFYWYIFNIADVAIVAGFVVLLYEMVWPGQPADKQDMS